MKNKNRRHAYTLVKRKKKIRKSKFVRPAAGLKPGGPVSQLSAEGGVRYHKGFVYDKLRYTVLTAYQMSKVDVDMVNATIKTMTMGPDAMQLPNGTNGWSCYVPYEMKRRLCILSYKGVEVAIFFQRQLTPIKLQAGDHHPEGVMQDPAEAWQRFDLLGKSAKQANVVLTNIHTRLEEELNLAQSRITTLDELNTELEHKLRIMQETWQPKPTKKKRTSAKSSQNARKSKVKAPLRAKKTNKTKKRRKK